MNTKKIFLIPIAIILLLILAFFGLFGIAQLHAYILTQQNIEGEYDNYNWSNTDQFEINNYPSFIVENGKTFKILALTDLHLKNNGWFATDVWTSNLSNNKVYSDIAQLISQNNPDLIILTGDLTSGTLNDIILEDLRDFLDGFKLPWAVTFGNHDAEHRADKAKLLDIILDSEYNITQQGPTNIGGLGNSIINLKNPQGKVFYSLFLLDSGDWLNKENVNKAFSTTQAGYSQLQLDWYEWAIRGTALFNGYSDISLLQSAIFSHLPSNAFAYATELGNFTDQSKPYDVENKFGVSTSYDKLWENDKTINRYQNAAYFEFHDNDPFFKRLKALDSTSMLVSGHNHCAGYTVIFDNITYISVAKTGKIFSAEQSNGGKIGGTIISFKNDGLTNAKAIHII